MAPRLVQFPTLKVGEIKKTFEMTPFVKEFLQADATYKGNPWGEEIDWNQDNATYQDVVYGNGGSDVIKTGGGADKVFVGSNTSTWDGDGNEYAEGATIVEGGSGNDHLVVQSGSTGSFKFNEEQTAGGGSDRLEARGGTYVDMWDNSDERDFFIFGSSFEGTGVIRSFDKGIDKLELFGDDWMHNRDLSTSSETVFTNSGNGKVIVKGIAGDGSNPAYELRTIDDVRVSTFETGNFADVLFA